MYRVIIVGPSRKTRGGITSVIHSYENTDFWNKWNCYWVESYIDRSSILKILYFIKGYFIFLFQLPFASIIHIHIALGTSAFRKKFFFYTAYFFRKKIILHFHTPGNAVEPPVDLPIIFKIFNLSDAVIVLSDGWKNLIKKSCPDANIYTIPNPAPPIKEITRNKKPWILFAGSLDNRKGFKDLIKAFSIIHEENPEWKLILAGNGMINEGKEITDKLRLNNHVIFKGWVKGNEKDYLFANSSIFCLPSYAEGLPVSILEALSYGLPIVCSPVGGINDFLKSPNDYLSCTPGNIKDIADKLMQLIKNVGLRQKMAVNAQKLADNLFSIKIISNIMNEVYKNILGKL